MMRGGWRGCFACSATGLVMLLAAPKAVLLRRVAVQAYVLGQGLLWCGAPCAGEGSDNGTSGLTLVGPAR